MGWMLLEGKYPVKKYLGRVPLGAGEGCVKHADVKEPPAGIRVLIGEVLQHVSLGEPLGPCIATPKSSSMRVSGDFVDRTLTFSGRWRDLVILLSSWFP